MIKLLIAWCKLSHVNVLACAPTGLASLDLFDGRTMHSRFRIPTNMDENTEPDFSTDSTQYLAEMAYSCDILILDEISPTHIDLVTYTDKVFARADSVNAEEFEGPEIPFGKRVRSLFLHLSDSLCIFCRLGCYYWWRLETRRTYN